jgi:hypothetical protein
MVRTGPATTYWNPANKAAGSYTVSATFNEPKYMNLMDHPHPYGIMIGRQRSRHRDSELHLLHGVRQRHVHRPRHGSRAVRGQRA